MTSPTSYISAPKPHFFSSENFPVTYELIPWLNWENKKTLLQKVQKIGIDCLKSLAWLFFIIPLIAFTYDYIRIPFRQKEEKKTQEEPLPEPIQPQIEPEKPPEKMSTYEKISTLICPAWLTTALGFGAYCAIENLITGNNKIIGLISLPVLCCTTYCATRDLISNFLYVKNLKNGQTQ